MGKGEPAGLPFPFLDETGLAAYALLGTPVYVYSFAAERICWCNQAALAFWNANSVDELLQRELGPYSTATAIRLEAYRETFLQGGQLCENWNFYPRDVPMAALCLCRGVAVPGHDEAMLVEIHAAVTSTLPPTDLRAIEATHHIPMMITLFSDEGQVLMRNPRAIEAFGKLDRCQPSGADHLKAMFATPAEAEDLLREASRKGEALATATMALPQWPVHSVKVSLVTDPVTGAPAWLVAQQDISELVAVSRRLAASEEALEAVLMLDVAPVLVLSVDGSSIIRTNRAAEVLFGNRASAGAAFAPMVVDPVQFDRLRGMLLTQGSASALLGLRAAATDLRWCSVTGTRIRYAEHDALVLVLANVDELYQTAVELETALALERRTNKLQRRFMAIANHEFRAPLAVIDSAAQQIQRRAATLSAEQIAGRVGRIRDAVRRLLHLYDATLDQARVDLGAMGFAPVPGQLSEIIGHVVEGFAIAEPAPCFHLDLPPLPVMPLDSGLMESAMANLVGNAVKYSEAPARIEIAAAAGIDEIVVTVRDYGIGIPAQDREAVFAERARGSNVGDRPGTGIGLWLVRQIVELHGGHIAIVDTPDGVGASFRIAFPRT